MNFETIVGIEIHVEMKTKSKMFSLAPISFGLKPNTEITSGNGTASSPYQLKYNS